MDTAASGERSAVSAGFNGSAWQGCRHRVEGSDSNGRLRVLQSRKFYKIHAYRTDCRIFKNPDPTILGKSSINPPKIGLPNRALGIRQSILLIAKCGETR